MDADFTRLWRAYAASTLGTWLALDAFPLIAIRVLHVGAAQVSLLAAAAGSVAAVAALPLGPWVEFRSKRPVMIGADLTRCAVLLTVPVAHALGGLGYAQLVVVAVVVALADIVFVGASGAHLKALVPSAELGAANRRFETTLWVSTAVGPPLGGGLIGLLGPMVTVVLNAVSFVLSAVGVRAIRAPEPEPPVRVPTGSRLAAVGEGWRAIVADRVLAQLFVNTVAVAALIMAAAPVLAYLLLDDLGWTPLEYGLALGVPCVAGVLGVRASGRLGRRFGQRQVLLGAGVVRVLPFVGLAFAGPGPAGLMLVIVVEAVAIAGMGVFGPILATQRLQRSPDGALARVLTSWTITSRTAIATATAGWGLLAGLTSARTALLVAGVLLVATTATLPWRAGAMFPA